MRATPENMMLYKHAIQLFKLYNSDDHNIEWSYLNDQQILTSRQTTFAICKGHKTRVGLNALSNRLYILNGKIPLLWLNLTFGTFKVKCKSAIL